MSSAAAQLTIEGVVQGVGYRYYCYQKAASLKLYGWAKNNPNGSVQVFVEGDRGAIEVFIKELKIGPLAASVSDIKIEWMNFTGNHDRFEISF
ncbi:MAG: acylphosphatase [Candidatus Zixiibacteriota bacterium]